MPNLADIILQGGRDRANLVLRQADIQAQRQSANARVWGDTVHALGTIGAQTIETLGQQPLIKARAANEKKQTELLDLNLQTAKDQRAASLAADAQSKALGALLTASRVKDPATGIDTYDRTKLSDGLAALKISPEVWGRVQPLLDASDKSVAAARTAQTQAIKDSLALVTVAGGDPQVALHEIDRLVQNHQVSETVALPYIQSIQKDPKSVQRIVDLLSGKKPGEGNVKLGADETLVGPQGETLATGKPKPPEQPAAVKEYEYYAAQEQAAGRKPLDFNGYQAMDANRKRPVTNVNTAADAEPLPMDPASQNILSQTGLSINAFRLLTGRSSELPRDAATRQKAAQEAQTWARSHNVDISTLPAQFKTYNEVLSANISRLNNTKIMESELEGTIDNLKGVAKDAELGKVNFGNVVKVWAGQQTNDSLAQQYALHLSQLRNELSAYYAATQGRTGNNITVQDQRDAEMVIKNGISAGSLDGLRTAIANSTAKMGTVMQGSVDRAQKQVWGLFGVGDNYKKAPGGDNKDPMGIRR